MTYNVFSGTLNHTQSITMSILQHFGDIITYLQKFSDVTRSGPRPISG